MLASRGETISYEAIRLWCGKFGPEYARKLRQYKPAILGHWHVDEVFLRVNGTIHYLWRAVVCAVLSKWLWSPAFGFRL